MSNYAIKLLSNETQLKEFKANALTQAQNFSIESILPQYENYYEHILKTSVPKEEAQLIDE